MTSVRIPEFWASKLKNIYSSKNKESVYFRNKGDFRAHPENPFISQIGDLGVDSLQNLSLDIIMKQ